MGLLSSTTTSAGMIDPHTGQPVEWSAAQGPSLGFGGIDPKMLALYQQAGLWKPEYSSAVTDWGSDPSSRAAARQQWMESPQYQSLMDSLSGWKQGQARKDYGLYDLLQDPNGKVYVAGSVNQGPSLHAQDYANMASVLLGGYGAAAGGAAGVGSSLYGLSGTQAAIAGGATLGAANGAVHAYANDSNVLGGALKGGITGGAGAYIGSALSDTAPINSGTDPYGAGSNWGQDTLSNMSPVDQVTPVVQPTDYQGPHDVYQDTAPPQQFNNPYNDYQSPSAPTDQAAPPTQTPSFKPSDNYGPGVSGSQTSAYDNVIKLTGNQDLANAASETTGTFQDAVNSLKGYTGNLQTWAKENPMLSKALIAGAIYTANKPSGGSGASGGGGGYTDSGYRPTISRGNWSPSVNVQYKPITQYGAMQPSMGLLNVPTTGQQNDGLWRFGLLGK